MIYTCYFCNKDIPGKHTKRCARCLLVTYCSKECQAASWKISHKHNCRIHPSLRLASPDDPNSPVLPADKPKKHTLEWEELQEDKSLSRWLQLWKWPLQTWATFALDLPNHPPERVMTHCLQLVVQSRSGHGDNPAKRFKVIHVSIVLFSDIMAQHNDLVTHIDPNDHSRVRFVAILVNENDEPKRLRLVQWNDLAIARFRTMDKDGSAIVVGGSRLSELLMEDVNSKDPQEVEEMLGKR